MTTSISQASMIRGADGRLYAVTAQGVTRVADAGATAVRSVVRASDRAAFDTADHEASRSIITPGF